MGKYLVCLIVLFVFGIGRAFADVEHTVVRGESIESIAEKYKISKESLIKANPGLDSLFYVGMKIIIPSDEVNDARVYDDIPSGSVPSINSVDNIERGNGRKDSIQNRPDSDDMPAPGIEMAMRICYGFIPKPEGVSQSPWAFAATVGANYWFIDKMSGPFAGVMIGYDSSSTSLYTFDIQTETSCHFISVPISAGYALAIKNKKFALTPYIGLTPKFCIKASGKSKVYGETVKYKGEKKFAMDFSYGIALRIMRFDLIGAFSSPLNDAEKGYFGDKPYFNLGLGFGF